MAKKVHVVPTKKSDGTPAFVVKVEGSAKPVTRPSTQAASIKKAIPIAKQKQSSVVIHRPDGTIRDADSYGDESKKRDTKH